MLNKKIRFSFRALILALMLLTQLTGNTQTLIRDDCFGNDLAGVISAGSPDVISFPDPSPDNLVFVLTGCMVPSQVDYNDLFTFQVPEGFVLTSIYLNEVWPLFENTTAVDFFFWLGNDCHPLFQPDVTVKEVMQNETPTGNLISGLTPLGPGWYSGWLDMDNWPSTTTYELYFVLACQDQEAPVFVTTPGGLNVQVSCSNEAALNQALALMPSGEDNNGGVTIELVDDETTPSPGCPNAYTRTRNWRVTDGCGNVGASLYTQIITVVDTEGPDATPRNGSIAIANIDGYVLTTADVLEAASDNCGDVEVTGINPSVLTCDQLDQTVPVTVELTDACGNTTEVVAMIQVGIDDGIKSPWENVNIGNTANGSATSSPCKEGFSVTSSGFSLPNADVGHLVYADLCGNGELIARVKTVSPMSGWGGIVLRESLVPGAKKIALRTGLNGLIRRDVRTTANMPQQTQQSIIVGGPVWFRLTRNGNQISASASPDGITWSFLGAAQINLPNCVKIGLFVESSANNVATTVTFDQVSITGGVQPLQWQESSPNAMAPATELTSEEPLAVPSLAIYPNPTSGQLYVKLDAYEPQLPMQVTIRALDGRALLAHKAVTTIDPLRLDVGALPPGAYLLELEVHGHQPNIQKLIISH